MISNIYKQSHRGLTNSNNLFRKNSQTDISSKINNGNCCCPFLRYLMSVWPNGKYECLYRFSQNYDLKISIGILYLFLYDKLILEVKNDFGYLRKEFLFSEIRIIITKHEKLLDNLLKSPKLIIENYIKPLFNLNIPKNSDNIRDNINQHYLSLKKVVNNLKFDNLLSNSICCSSIYCLKFSFFSE